jgi:hypothetical protein
MASYCGWFFFATQKIFQTLTAHRIPENGSIHYDPRHSNKLWSCLKKRHYSPFHHMVYIYVYIYILYIYLVFHIKNQVLDVLGGSLSFFFGFFVARLHGLELPLWPARRTARSVVSIVETDATVSEETTDALAVWKSGWWLMMMVALW